MPALDGARLAWLAFHFRRLDNGGGPQKSRHGFFGVDGFLEMNVMRVIHLHAHAITSAVNIHQTLLVDLGIGGDTPVTVAHHRRILRRVEQAQFDPSRERVGEHGAAGIVGPIVGLIPFIHYLEPASGLGILGAFQAGGQAAKDVLHLGAARMVLGQIRQRLHHHQRIPAQPFAPDFRRQTGLRIGPLGRVAAMPGS